MPWAVVSANVKLLDRSKFVDLVLAFRSVSFSNLEASWISKWFPFSIAFIAFWFILSVFSLQFGS